MDPERRKRLMDALSPFLSPEHLLSSESEEAIVRAVVGALTETDAEFRESWIA